MNNTHHQDFAYAAVVLSLVCRYHLASVAGFNCHNSGVLVHDLYPIHKALQHLGTDTLICDMHCLDIGGPGEAKRGLLATLTIIFVFGLKAAITHQIFSFPS